MKKWLIGILVSIIMLVLLNYVRISFDKDSIYKAEIPKTARVATISNVSQKDFYKNIHVSRQPVKTELGEHEVLVLVKSATFTQKDFDFFKNNKDKKSFVPCTDFSGKVVKVGSAVKDYEIGDDVFGIVDIERQNGACADYVIVPENNINDIPYSLSYKQASAIPTPGLLNWFAVHSIEKKGLKKGKVLVDDAISETGIMLTGLLVRNGFEVTAIDEERVASWVEAYGVKNFVSNEDFAKQKKTLKGQFDVVINLSNGKSVEELLPMVKKGGLFISFEKTSLSRKDVRMLIFDATLIDNAIFAKMARLVHLGKLQVNIVNTFDLEHIRDAYIQAQKGNNNGKVVVEVNR